jgi:hypothetical protein
VPDGPWRVLTRHFFAAMFDFGFLSEEGAESFKRLLMGMVAVALGTGLLLARVFIGKYRILSTGPAEAYQLALTADHAFLIALPMWIVAAAVVLFGHSLFPNEVDYRILMAEPVPRRLIFGAKLAALLLFIALFVGGAHAALLPLFVLTMFGQPGPAAILANAAAFAFSSAAAGLFSALTIVGINGALVLCAPRSRLPSVVAAVRGALLTVLVLAVPFLLRLPGTAQAFAADAWWLRWAPPAWFVGLERWLLGDGTRSALAITAASATLMVLTVSITSYIVLYRRFDRVTLRPAVSHAPLFTGRWPAPASAGRPVRVAVHQFTSRTLRRSQLHQGIILAALAAAAGFVVNAALVSGFRPEPVAHREGVALPWIVVWAPMTLIFIAVPAVRLALSVPMDLRASWVFRMTEDGATRPDAIDAGVRTVLVLGVTVPIVLVAPLQAWVIGPLTVRLIVLEWLCGWLLVEIYMREWRRIPFTCTYLPGKEFVPHMVFKRIGAYLVFTAVTFPLLHGSTLHTATMLIAVVVVGGLATALRWNRVRQAKLRPLLFEDELPTDVIPLRLGAP